MLSVQHISIDVDLDWKSEFVPWLEAHEQQHLGVEDGAFLVTVASSLRVLQPDGEGPFIKECLRTHLSSLQVLTLKEFQQKGIYEFSATQKEDLIGGFKKIMQDLNIYRSDTCCTSVLKQCKDIESVFKHLDSDVCSKYAFVDEEPDYGSRVMLDESGIKTEQLFNKYSKDLEGFPWRARQRNPPDNCPQSECTPKDDDIEIETQRRKRFKGRSLSEIVEPIYYGYGLEMDDRMIQITANLNLSRIFNILWLLPIHYPGLHSPYLYFGTTHSFFPVHVEDGLTYSLNYLHVGHPKVWVIIPPWATELLEYYLAKCCVLLYHTSCRNILGHKCVLPTLSWLQERNIPFKVVIQRPGDLVVLYPSSAHFGFNLGPNIAQAVNIGTKSWIPWGINAKKCTCFKPTHQMHIDMAPLVTAFRKDLIPHLMTGGVVLTQEMARGMKLVADAVVNCSLVWKDKASPIGNAQGQRLVPFKCPVDACEKTFNDCPVDTAKKNMIKHVKSIHRPLVDKCQLLLKIDQIFDPVPVK